GIWQNEKFVYPINNIQRVFNLTAYNIKNGLIAIMFQDNSEKFRFEEIKSQQINELHFLAETALDLVIITDPLYLYKYYGDKMKEIVGDLFLIVGEYNEDAKFYKPQSFFGFDEKISTLTKILGKDPKKMEVRVRKNLYNKLKNGKFELLNIDTQDLIIDDKKTNMIKHIWKTFGLENLYCTIISKDEKNYGIVVFALKKGNKIKNLELIEALTHQLASALFRYEKDMELFESEYRFFTLVELLNDGLGIDDVDGNLIYVNHKLSEFLGYSRDELIGKPVINFLVEESKKIYSSLIDMLDREELTSYNLQWIRKDGTVLETKVKPKPLINRFNEHIGSYAVITDITEITEAHNKLKESQTELQIKKDELDSFASTVAHDFRGKLQILSSLVDLEETQYTEMILDQIDLLSIFIEDLLILARKGSVLGEFKEIDLQTFIEKMTTDLLIINNKIEYIVKDLPKIIADPIKLKQVFENLFMNIIKHAKATKVEVTAKELKNDYKIKIVDNGVGISENKLAEIKKSWETRRYKSFGMLIVLKIVEAHKGKLFLDSTINKGTKVTIVLPKLSDNS
ncbi:MAG: PAS domain S-box protein, partial [Candidatus Heimdallarchaeota archaeon]